MNSIALILAVCRTPIIYELSEMTLLSMSSRSSVDRAPARCSGGHGFDSCRGLRIFLCPTLVSCWLIHLHISLPSLKFTIFINLLDAKFFFPVLLLSMRDLESFQKWAVLALYFAVRLRPFSRDLVVSDALLCTYSANCDPQLSCNLSHLLCSEVCKRCLEHQFWPDGATMHVFSACCLHCLHSRSGLCRLQTVRTQ